MEKYAPHLYGPNWQDTFNSSKSGTGQKKFTRLTKLHKHKKFGKGSIAKENVVFLPSDENSLREIMARNLSSLKAGNKSSAVKNQLSAVLDRFVEMKKFSPEQRRILLKQYTNK
jgi:hypothetical protein